MNISSFLRPARVLVLGALLLGTSECSLSDKVKEAPGTKSTSVYGPLSRAERKQTRLYEQMDFRLNFVDEARLAGQDILFARQVTDFTAPQQTRLQTALEAGNLPLRLRMRIYARNTSNATIVLKQLDYQVMLDDRELASGTTNHGHSPEVEPHSIVTLPVNINVNVALSLPDSTSAAAFAVGLADFTGTARRLTLLIRPTYVSATGRIFESTEFMPIELVTTRR